MLAGVDLAAVDYVALSTSQRYPFIAIDCDFSVSVGAADAYPAPGQMLLAAQRRGSFSLLKLEGSPARHAPPSAD